jgi:hypothetical protein
VYRARNSFDQLRQPLLRLLPAHPHRLPAVNSAYFLASPGGNSFRLDASDAPAKVAISDPMALFIRIGATTTPSSCSARNASISLCRGNRI